MRVGVVIPAAGEGRRFAGRPLSVEERKQFRRLGDAPLVIQTVRRFCQSLLIERVIVPVAPDAVEWMGAAIGRESPARPVEIIEGGAMRQESVHRGVARLGEEIEVVIVHDAVRPFFNTEWIEQTCALCNEFDGAIVAVPMADTVKEVSGATVVGTVNRNGLWQAQTPQTFRRKRLSDALREAEAGGWQETDEASAVERAGGKVAVITGDKWNIKITTADDWRLAEVLWLQQSRVSGTTGEE